MHLRWPTLAALFVLGAAIAPIGDHIHVVSGTTRYTTDAVPFFWEVPVWFPIMVGLGTAALAEIRLHLGAARPDRDVRCAVGGVAAVMGSYALTGLLHDQPAVAVTTLLAALAAVTWAVLGDGPSVVCGIVAAVVGVSVEIAMVGADLFEYTDGSDGLAGVAPWLVPLYFAFGVVAALLGELASGRDGLTA